MTVAVDTSVAVPAMVTWHPEHRACRGVAEDAAIPAHAVLESYSVMTRLPGKRLGAEAARALILGWFDGDRILAPVGVGVLDLVTTVSETGVVGGATYDALVGATARDHGRVLVSRDRRAAATYRRLGIDYELV
ncbi:MAG: PIN domain-containing protein [Kineosporiaceae bacterium]